MGTQLELPFWCYRVHSHTHIHHKFKKKYESHGDIRPGDNTIDLADLTPLIFLLHCCMFKMFLFSITI